MINSALNAALVELSEGTSGQDPVRLVPFRDDAAGTWDAFVESSRNGTIFHQRRFLSYHAADRFVDHSFLAFRGDRLIAVYPGAIRDTDRGRWWSSHPGSSYGGPVLGWETTLDEVAAVLVALVGSARDQGLVGMDMRLPEQAFYARPSDEIEYCLWRLGFERRAVELSTAIPLFEGRAAAEARYRWHGRRRVKKARRVGVKVQWSDAFEAYWKILEQNLERHSTHPTHTIQDILRLRELCGDRIRLATAEVDGKLAGGIVVFVANRVAFHSFYIAQDFAFQQSETVGALIDFLVQWGCDSGFRYFNIGISTERGGAIINWGLFAFKQAFGGSGYVRTSHQLALR